ncbi:RNA polymerase sigma factor [Paenibacillus sp. 22594]|uniref:RNA polymerase sigma factor n=1 Tax=Paenibacillus sp. 22594 TaxID=3453947 RepID=UPI003F86E597
MDINDSELNIIKDIIKGNKEAYAFLVDKYKNKIYGLLLKMGASPEDAQDITQETFITAYRMLGSHHTDRSFAGWIYTIAIRTLQERYRGQKRLEHQAIPSDLPSTLPNPENEVIYQENKSELNRMVNKLPHNYKFILMLRYTNDLTYEEMEKITGMSSNQIRNGLHRAKKRLQKMILKEGVDLNEMLEHYTDGRVPY